MLLADLPHLRELPRGSIFDADFALKVVDTMLVDRFLRNGYPGAPMSECQEWGG